MNIFTHKFSERKLLNKISNEIQMMNDFRNSNHNLREVNENMNKETMRLLQKWKLYNTIQYNIISEKKKNNSGSET
jgi:hypothetical protein